MSKDITLVDRIAWALTGTVLGGTFGGSLGFFLSKAVQNIPPEIAIGFGFFGLGALVILRQFGMPININPAFYKPTTKRQALDLLNSFHQEEKRKKIYDSGTSSQMVVKETTKIVLHITSEGRGIMTDDFDFSPEKLKQIGFYLAFWPKTKWRLSVPFLKDEAKILPKPLVYRLQDQLIKEHLAQPKEKGREGREGVELLYDGKLMFRALGLQYSPTPTDKDRFKLALSKDTVKHRHSIGIEA